MDKDWAAENLQVIRTLMERSALYRRALAPIMVVIGAMGILGSLIPIPLQIESNAAFTSCWLSIGLCSLVAAFLLVRRQALQAREPFWSSATRRVTQALLPAFFIGFAAGLSAFWSGFPAQKAGWILPPAWMVCYGCGLHAAGFFMERGIKLFGWAFVLAGSALALATLSVPKLQSMMVGNCAMGIFFGAFQLAFGIYLHSTERRRNET